MAKYRKTMSRGKSRRAFTKYSGTHKFNIPRTVKRGGWRL